MYFTNILLLSLLSYWLVSTDGIRSRSIYGLNGQDTEEGGIPLTLRPRSLLTNEKETQLQRLENDANERLDIPGSSLQRYASARPYVYTVPSNLRPEVSERTVQRQKKKISARSDEPGEPDTVGKLGGPSVKDLPVDQNHKVLEFAMKEQRKKQERLQKQSHEFEDKAGKSEADEFSALQRIQGAFPNNDVRVSNEAKLEMKTAEAKTEQYRKDSATAMEGMKESAIMMHRVGSVNKHMRSRMKETFNPLPVPKDPFFRSKTPTPPTRPTGPSMSTMKNRHKYRVLEWVMQNQVKKQKEAVKQTKGALGFGMNAAFSEHRAGKIYANAKNLNEYRQGKRMLLTSKKIQEHAIAQHKQAEVMAEKTGKQIETIGMVNKNLRNRMLKSAAPLANPNHKAGGELALVFNERMQLGPNQVANHEREALRILIKKANTSLKKVGGPKAAETEGKSPKHDSKEMTGSPKTGTDAQKNSDEWLPSGMRSKGGNQPKTGDQRRPKRGRRL